MHKIIAIDGPASVGKSTLAKKLAEKYSSPILFSGKLYRAVALELIRRKSDPSNIPVSYTHLTLPTIDPV